MAFLTRFAALVAAIRLWGWVEWVRIEYVPGEVRQLNQDERLRIYGDGSLYGDPDRNYGVDGSEIVTFYDDWENPVIHRWQVSKIRKDPLTIGLGPFEWSINEAPDSSGKRALVWCALEYKRFWSEAFERLGFFRWAGEPVSIWIDVQWGYARQSAPEWGSWAQ